ncbi:MAG: hypothetical protein JXX14_24445 [Deltaproteobacteria bacterium]|nr:hypothetical protein [Deltaproteobacteria bacterium]
MTSAKMGLTAGAQSILDFENALNDWTTPNPNSVLSTSYNATSGVFSLAVTPNGWTELHSPPLSTLGSMKSAVSLDVFVPEVLNWGELRIVVQIPSKNIWWSELGSQALADLPVGQFTHVEFMFPPETLAALESEYDDARLIVIVNAPALFAPYLLDNIVMTNDPIPEPEPISTEGEVVEFSLKAPGMARLLTIALNSHTTMKIGANVQVESPELNMSTVSSLGATTVRMAEPDTLLGNVITGGNADIGDRVHLLGSLIAKSVTLGQNVQIDGETVTDAMLLPISELAFRIEFPTTKTETTWLEPLQTKSLTPGGYGMVRVGPNATLALESGKYYVDTLNLDDSSNLVLKQTDGPIIVYAKEIVAVRSAITTTTGEDAEWVLVYLGQQDLNLDRNFTGTVVAPNAKVSLFAGTHTGAFYANAINVEANTHVIHHISNAVLTSSGVDVVECTGQVVGPENVETHQADVEFGKAQLKYCMSTDIDDCYMTLAARAQVDRTSAALQFVNEEMSGRQYLGVARHRSLQMRHAREDQSWALTLCNDADGDGDWVKDDVDICPGTVDLMPVDDNGCPTELPDAPDDDAVRAGLEEYNIIVDNACRDANVPGISAPGGFFWTNNQQKVFLVISEVTNQPYGCVIYYQFEIQGETRDGQKAHLLVTFKDEEKSSDLVDLGRPVPHGQIQFIVTDADTGDKGKLANDIKPYRGTFRVRAVNSAGVRGHWSQWKTMSQKDCLSLGFRCANFD